jgi:DNA-binding transcriptional MerR regulator
MTALLPSGPGPELPDPDIRLTVDEFAHQVGMSARNIRAHQARGLLSQPIRIGRVAYYDENHIRRIEAIKNLQRQGFNLVSIASILGVRESGDPSQAWSANLDRFWVDHPAVMQGLLRHGVLSRGADGTVRTTRPRLLRAAFTLRRAGVAPSVALQALVDILDQVQTQADELVHEVGLRLVTTLPSAEGAGLTCWEDLDRETTALTQGITILLAEAFQATVERSGQVRVPDLMARHSGVSFPVDQSPDALDVG